MQDFVGLLKNLSDNEQACLYSWEKKIPLVAFSEGRCLTLFDHPLVDSLHTTYHEPKVSIVSSRIQIILLFSIKIVFFSKEFC